MIGYSIEDARNADSARRVQKRENKLQDILDVQAEGKMTFKELTKWWLSLENVKARSDVWRLALGAGNFNAVFGDKRVCDVRLSDLKNYQATRKRAGAADRTIDAETHDAAKTMVRAAWLDNKISKKTWTTWELFKKLLSGKNRRSNARSRVLEIGEYCRLTDHLSKHLVPLVATALYTGAREGELIPIYNGGNPTKGLTHDRIDFKNGIIKLDGKTGRREIPMCKGLRDVLQAIPRPLRDPAKHHVFMFRGRALTNPWAGLQAACKEADIPYGAKVEGGFVFRDLRRTAKTLMARAGVDKAYRDAILGHEPQDMDAHYMKPSIDDLRAAVERFGAWLDVQITAAQKQVQKGMS